MISGLSAVRRVRGLGCTVNGLLLDHVSSLGGLTIVSLTIDRLHICSLVVDDLLLDDDGLGRGHDDGRSAHGGRVAGTGLGGNDDAHYDGNNDAKHN